MKHLRKDVAETSSHQAPEKTPLSETPPQANRQRLWRWLGVCGTAVALAMATGSAWVWHTYTAPGPLATEQLLYLPPGSTARAVIGQLEARGIIAAALPFTVAETLQGHTARYQAGEYRFPPHISPREASALLRSGKTVQRRLVVIEGQTVSAVQAAAATLPGLSGNWPKQIPEGSLLAETWFYQWGDSKAALVQRMQTTLQTELQRLWAERAPDLPLKTPEEALILASIVEKETGHPDERGLVASVFLNRLQKGMPLQSDPTVIYALTEGKGALERRLLRADWGLEHPFNTYRIPGLPPAPIANTGRAALQAVLQPPKTDFLFFVADGKGGHVFARTLAEHNKNVAALQKLRAANRKEQQETLSSKKEKKLP